MKRRDTLACVGAVAAVMLVACLFTLFGCAERPESSGTPASADTTLTAPGEVTPGIQELPYGRIQAAGTVAHIDLEGGFWALTQLPSNPSSSTADIVVVVLNAEHVGLPKLAGKDVIVDGTLVQGASIRMAGPEMNAEHVTLPR